MKRQSFVPGLEALEDRSVPAVTTSFANGILTVSSDAAADTVVLTKAADGRILRNGAAIPGTPRISTTAQLRVLGNGGRDTVTVNLPGYRGTTRIDGGADNDQLRSFTDGPTTLLGGSGNDLLLLPIGEGRTDGGPGFDLTGFIGWKWLSLRNQRDAWGRPVTDVLGQPTADEQAGPVPGSRVSPFQGGSIYWSAQTNAHVIYGAIGNKYRATVNTREGVRPVAAVVGLPTTDEVPGPGSGSRVSHFQRGSITWTSQAGAHVIYGAIWAKSRTSIATREGLRVVATVLGPATTEELDGPVPGSRVSHFERGSIYWSQQTGAHVIYGAIWSKYGTSLATREGVRSVAAVLGLPTTDELGTPDGVGRYTQFQHGSIYWTPQTGAHVVYGAIRDKWISLGWERSALGYPSTDELGTPDGVGRYNHFQGGSIYWTQVTGAHEVHGAIRDKWASLGWERGALGYPISDVMPGPNGVGQVSLFQRGQISWSPALGEAVVSWVSNDLAGTGQPDLPVVSRHVSITAHMEVTDDDGPFDDDEYGHADGTSSVIATTSETRLLLRLIGTAGDEVRVELILSVQVKLWGDVVVTGSAALYEGASASSDDLDGWVPISFEVLRDQSASMTIWVYNLDEGGDFATITLKVENTAV